MQGFLKTGERIFTPREFVNVKHGITRKDDVLSKMIFEPAEEGERAGEIPFSLDPTLCLSSLDLPEYKRS